MPALMQEITLTLTSRPAMAATFHFVFCACLGSYFNLFAWRWPQIQERQWMAEIREWFEEKGWTMPQVPPSEPKTLTLSTPGSFCPCCGVRIKPWHNVPLLGWLALRGRAACCGKPISIKYPLFEALCGSLGAFAWLYFGEATAAWTFLLLAMPLCMASQTDFESMMLPDSVTAFILFCGLGLAIFGLSHLSPRDAFIGMGSAFVTLAAIRIAGTWAFKREAMGQGDPKLFAALGAWIGWAQLPQALLAAALGGLIYALARRTIVGDKNPVLPFGPFLAFGGLACYVWRPLLT